MMLDILLEEFTMSDDQELLEHKRMWDDVLKMEEGFMWFEAVSTPRGRVVSSAKEVIDNTKETISDTVEVSDNVTTAGGRMIKALWDVFINSLKVVVKSISFITNNLSKIPKFAARLIKRSANIPEEIRSKIRGDISIYITPDDLIDFYNIHMPKLIQFVQLSKTISIGNKFSEKSGRIFSTGGDMKIFKDMNTIYKYFNSVTFEKSSINIKDQAIADSYFSNTTKIEFVDPSNSSRHSVSYIEGLRLVAETLAKQKTLLEDIEKDISTKITVSQSNNSFSKMSTKNRENILSLGKMMARIFTVIGQFTSSSISDLRTLDNNIGIILKKSGITPVKA